MGFLSNWWAELTAGVTFLGVLAKFGKSLIVPAWKHGKKYIPRIIEAVFDYLEEKTKNEALKKIIKETEINVMAAEEKVSLAVDKAASDGELTKEELELIKNSLRDNVKKCCRESLADSKHIAVDYGKEELDELTDKIIDSIVARFNVPKRAAKAVANAANPL